MAKKSNEEIPEIVLNAVALGMGVCAVVLSLLGGDQAPVSVILGVGLACLGIAGLSKIE